MQQLTKISYLKKQKYESIMDVIFLAPQFILYFSLTILPFIIAIPIIFTDQISFVDNDISFIGLANFKSIFEAPLVDIFLPSLVRSGIFMILNYSTVYLFGLTLALLMYEFNSRLKKPFFTVIYLPYIISGLGIGLVMFLMFSNDSGSINLLFLRLGILKEAIDIKDPGVSRWMFPLVVGWRYAGFNMAIFLSGLLSIPVETIEAAKVDGVNYIQKLWYIYLPQIVNSIMVATVICLIGSWGVFDEAVGMGALAANKNVEFFSVVLYKIGFKGAGSTGTLAEAVTMSMFVHIPLLAAGIWFTKLQKKFQY